MEACVKLWFYSILIFHAAVTNICVQFWIRIWKNIFGMGLISCFRVFFMSYCLSHQQSEKFGLTWKSKTIRNLFALNHTMQGCGIFSANEGDAIVFVYYLQNNHRRYSTNLLHFEIPSYCMASCTNAVSPLLMHWIFHSVAFYLFPQD